MGIGMGRMGSMGWMGYTENGMVPVSRRGSIVTAIVW